MKLILPDIDFGDASYKSCQTVDKNLHIYLSSWDHKKVKIVFANAIQFIYRGGSFISGVYELCDGRFLEEALFLYYEQVPIDHPFKNYLILDIEDIALFEIISESITVTKEG